MDGGIWPQLIVQSGTIGHAAAIDEDHDILAQMVLVIEHVRAQQWVAGKSDGQGGTQGQGVGLDRRHGQET